MRALQKQHIVDIFVWVDDSLPKPVSARGRKPTLTDSELLTILIWDGLTEPHKTLRSVYSWIARDYGDCFPKLPAYQNFVAHCHRLLPTLTGLLQATLSTVTPLRFVDSTMLEVCKLVRADRHKVARGVAAFGKNHQGWHYGFKLHAAMDRKGRLAAIYFTPANESDVLQLKKLVNATTRVVVGDAGYTAKVTRRHLWRDYRTAVISPPRPKQRWLMARWQHLLLTMRPKIEATFGKLKTKHFLVTSFPRSVQGYALHYIRTLIGYQMSLIS
jgi:transposase